MYACYAERPEVTCHHHAITRIEIAAPGIVTKVLRILDALHASPAGFQLKGVAEEAGLNKSTALASLCIRSMRPTSFGMCRCVPYRRKASSVALECFVSRNVVQDRASNPATALGRNRRDSEFDRNRRS